MQETIKNRTIFCRDNLEIFKGVDDKSVDLIYLDPPFNKNKDFIAPIGKGYKKEGDANGKEEFASFKDIFGTEDIKDEWVGLIADEHPTLHNYLAGIGKVGHKSNKYYLCYMAVRLIECHRILKDTGSLYYHCDPTMSHYIKVMLDCIFGEDNFRNEIIWSHQGSWIQPDNKYPRRHDTLLHYTKNESAVFNLLYESDFQQQMNYLRWRKYVVGNKIYGKNMPSHDKRFTTYLNAFRKEHNRDPNDEDVVLEIKGSRMGTVQCVKVVDPKSRERTGYPTQKPIALIERIIKASSNEGGVVLDPFCGCATTCIAAEKLDRQWIGIDVSEKAFDLVRLRIKTELEDKAPLLLKDKIAFRKDIPQRTDIDYKPDKLNDKHYLFGKQEGQCNGCATLFSFRHFHIDHIYPRSKGGGDNIENLQLLCGSCNNIKGDRDMAYLKARLREMDII